MARTVVYEFGVSLDGYIAAPDGSIDWTTPDEEEMTFRTAHTAELDAHLCGRRLYQDMLPWEKGFTFGESGPDFARIWQNLPKVVFSRTLERVEGNATLASQPVADELDRLDGLVAVGGAGLAATLAAQDLIDEYRTFTYPIVLGGGTPYLPHLAGPLALELVESRAIGQIVYQRHRRIRS